MKFNGVIFFALTLCGIMFTACAPKIYVIDRHTIMEKEAAGEWPSLEKRLLEKSKKKGPSFFQKDQGNRSKKRLLNVLNGELALAR